ncbi:MAG TPA: hypothetical protein PKG90_03305 [Chitinophagaceae bacterium]|nr:hypothetical protein [Chitinophagaceae bacterium]
MNLRDTILAQHSKTNCTKIVQWIGNNQERFNTLFNLFLYDNDWCVTQRASWPLSYAVQRHPELIKPHFGKLLKNLKKPKLHDAIKRNTVRLLQDITVPERFRGDLMDICFDYISSPVEKPAIKAFSLTILHNLSTHYPDIKQELKTIIEDRWEYETAAFKSRARKILKELS